MESGNEQSYWPGFVDALSNVVLTLVFVLVIIVFALVIASNKVEQKVTEISRLAQAREKQKIVTEAEMLDLRKELREAMKDLQAKHEEIERLKRELEELRSKQLVKKDAEKKVDIVVKAKPSTKGQSGDSDVDKDLGVIVISFPTGVFEMSDKAKQELENALLPMKAKLAGLSPRLRTLPGAETYSEGRRLAYFRGLSVRNFLIDKGLGTGRTISVTLDQAEEVGDGRVEIRFVRN